MARKNLNSHARKDRLAQLSLAIALCFCLPAGGAELTQLADAPLSSSAAEQVPPNIMFILDDSGSMAWTHLPDISNSSTIENNTVGYRNHLCNPMYFNPDEVYKPPVDKDGKAYDDMDFDKALYNGFIPTDKSPDTGTSKINLGSQFRAYDTKTTANMSGGSVRASAEAAHYYKWKGAGTPSPTECDKRISNPGSNWEKVTAADFTDDDKTNFANWYSYYRTRMLLMKTAAGRAFSILDKHYRVGFLTINPMKSSGRSGQTIDEKKYLKISEFESDHKEDWYDIFYSQIASGGTPLREALSRAGRHFAGKSDGINNGMTDDPLLYSCQPNFAILTTDGTWNGNPGQTINGGSIGNQDGDLAFTPRPMYDGGEVEKKDITTYTEWRYRSRNSGKPKCSEDEQSATKETRTITVTTTTTQYGTSSTKPTTGSTKSQNICLPDGVDRTTNWAIESGSETNETIIAGKGSASNTLADVAEYYYRTDLRSDTATRTGPNGEQINIGADNVPVAGTGPEDDKATHQHMTTFTVGLGVSGRLNFDPNYKSAKTGDFQDIRDGKKGWPDPNSSDLAKTDDLWHAAVNGRGQAFSAQDPYTLATSLQGALSNIQARIASSAAAATSNLEPTETDRLVFLPKYVSAKWTGEIEAHLLNLTTGEVEDDLTWSAQAGLDGQTQADCDDRNIYLYRKGATNNLVDFAWDTKACEDNSITTGLDPDEKAFFSSNHINGLSQWLTMSDGTDGTANQKAAAADANLVNFVRGQRGKEGYMPNDADKLYREREHVLGDIVGAQPVYVAAPAFAYTENGYPTFKTNNASRAGMVYAASNGGMLHAFKVGTLANNFADGGKEAWAFIPRTVLPNLYKLADTNWASKHEFLVDGSPVVGDIYDTSASAWKTILVGGLNKGGKAYYALDITNPNSPKALWEFAHSDTCYDKDAPATHYADCHIGYTFGNPIITKIAGKDASNNEWQKWVVLVTSGYNNVNEPAKAGDGVGYLYVLDAVSGRILHKVSTGYGDSGAGDNSVGPSGLAKINNWVVGDAYFDAKSSAVYGGDLLGNIYRFNVDVEPPTVKLIGTAKDDSGAGQPITTKPELAEVGTPPSPYVYVATGRYLASPDVSNTQTQSLYAIKDPGAAAGYTNLRDSLLRLEMTNVNADNERFVNCFENCSSTNGWTVDFPDSGERVNVDMKLQLGTLMVLSNVPKNNTCEPGGYSYANYFHYASGQSPLGIGQPIGGKLSGSLAVGFNVIRLPSGKVIVISTDAAGNTSASEAPIGSGAPTGKRVSWRELLN